MAADCIFCSKEFENQSEMTVHYKRYHRLTNPVALERFLNITNFNKPRDPATVTTTSSKGKVEIFMILFALYELKIVVPYFRDSCSTSIGLVCLKNYQI